MIIPQFHRRPVPLDADAHRHTTLDLPWSDWSIAAGMNAVFVGVGEMAEASHDFPLVFIRAGQTQDGKTDYAPIAVMGLEVGQNLFVDGKSWRGRYEPVLLRTYPFAVARVDDKRYALCLDADWQGVREDGQGERVLDDAGKPTEFVAGIQRTLEQFEADVERTRGAMTRLAELGLLRDMRFNGTLRDGKQVSIDGFLAIDEAKVRDLPDDEVLKLHREGLFPLIHAHWFSLGHIRRLLDWHAERLQEQPAGDAADQPAAQA